MGGETKSKETVNTARVFDFRSGYWLKMGDMQTKRSWCSPIVINNTIFVGGEETGLVNFSNIVEILTISREQSPLQLN